MRGKGGSDKGESGVGEGSLITNDAEKAIQRSLVSELKKKENEINEKNLNECTLHGW